MATNNNTEKHTSQLYPIKGKVRDMYDYKKVYITTPKPELTNDKSEHVGPIGKALTLITMGVCLGISIIILTLIIDGSNIESYYHFLASEVLLLPCASYLFYKNFLT